MKKKILNILLVAIIILGLTGCGNSTSSATVVNNENKTEKLSSKDIYNINEENEAKFKKYYVGAKISFDGTVESVETKDRNCYDETTFERWQSDIESTVSSSNSSDTRGCAVINFKEGYKLIIPESDLIDIADISSGDKYHVESNIAYMWNEQVECFGINEDKTVDFDLTKISAK